MKRFLTLLALMAICICSYAYDFEEGGIYYDVTYHSYSAEYTASVTYKSYDSKSYSGIVVIPSEVTHNGTLYSVTDIGGSAFANCSGLTSVTIPNSVTSIGGHAFYGCYFLTSVTIGNNVTRIGDAAFCNCPLTSITIPNSVTSIGKEAFRSCYGLASVTIPNSVTTIGSDAFANCSHLTSVVISCADETDFIKYLSRDDIKSVFHTSELSGKEHKILVNGIEQKDVVIPNSVTSIGSYAFKNCSGLTSITIPNSVRSIRYWAFEGCSSLSSVAVSCADETDFAKYLSRTDIYSVFHAEELNGKEHKILINGVELQKDVVIPNTVTSIGDYAFYGYSFYSVTIPNSVTSIKSDAFKGTNIVKTIWLTNTPPSGYENAVGQINYVANDQYTHINSEQKKVYPYLSSMFETDGIKYVPVSPSERTCDAIDCVYGEQSQNIVIAENVSYKGIAMKVKNVNPYTCYKNECIKSVKISHEGGIGTQAFYGCSGLQKATISNQGNIGESAFENCFQNGQDGIVTIESSSSIEKRAFYRCLGIKTLSLKTNGYIGESAFEVCTSIENATIAEGVTTIGSRAFDYCILLKEIIIPNSVTDINSSAFRECESLKKAIIGSGVTNIGSSAFESCSSLTNVTFIASKTNMSIGYKAFRLCTSLPQIDLPQNASSIDDYAFSGCWKLKNVTIADRTTSMYLGSNGSSPLFNDCPLETVYIGGPIHYSKSSSFGCSPFYRNTTLKSVTITDKEIEIYDNEFYGCTALKDVKIGDGVTQIGNWAFSGCTSLESFSFGSKTKNIGQEAFSDCTALTQITTRAINPPVCGNQALDDINKWSCTLTVPGQSVSLYQAADQWKEFFFIEANPNSYRKVTVESNDIKLGSVSGGGTYFEGENVTVTATPAKGCRFVQWSNGVSENPYSFVVGEDMTLTATFELCKYTITFDTDGGSAIDPITVDYGTSITKPANPTKTGYTFVGWDKDIPSTMPDEDIVIKAIWKINQYKVTFIVDGETVSEELKDYDSVIEQPEDPVNEGHTFNGWDVEFPIKVPANDITITGSFSINSYTATYIFNGEVVGKVEIQYGSPIPPFEYTPTDSRYIITRWISDAEYDTMPAKDITFYAEYTDGIPSINNDNLVDVYTVNGVKIRRNVSKTEIASELPAGMYIINGKKVIVK